MQIGILSDDGDCFYDGFFGQPKSNDIFGVAIDFDEVRRVSF